MAPAVTPIPETPEGEVKPTCISCIGLLSDSASKCVNCQAFVHLSFSGLPNYFLIRLSITQSSYSCKNCVKTKDLKGDEEKLNVESAKILVLIAKEQSIVRQIADDSSLSDVHSNNNQSEQTNQTVTSRNEEDAPKPVSKFYLHKACKHGKGGIGCKFEHPKLCFNYIKRGDKRGGCKKGEQCPYTHPKLCRRGLDSRVCTNKRCKFYHVSGTKFSIENRTNESPDDDGVSERPTPTRILQRTYSSIVSNGKKLKNSFSNNNNPDNGSNNLEDDWAPSNRCDFLELKHQMKALQDQIQMLFSVMKPQIPQFHHPPPAVNWAQRV